MSPPYRQRHQSLIPDERFGELARALEEAYRRKEALERDKAVGLADGGDTSPIQAEILSLRRRLREGGRLRPGDFLLDGRFRLLEPIGQGGFAQVWKVYDRRESSMVAIKVLHGQYGEDRSRRERFFRGARKMAELQHPGIVRVIEKQCEDGGFYFFVMEYVSGGDLRKAVLAGELSRTGGLRILLELAAALAFAHSKGVVHRDVKPGNVLLDPEGHPKLTDFDLVWAMDTTGGTRTHGMLGTIQYAAPELLENARDTGPVSDVYSLGMTAAFVFSGHELPTQVYRDPEGFVRTLSIPGAAREALARALRFDPAERLATVTELCSELEAALTDLRSPRPPAASARKEQKGPGRRPELSEGTEEQGQIEDEYFDESVDPSATGDLPDPSDGSTPTAKQQRIHKEPWLPWLDQFTESVPWARALLERLEQDCAEPTWCRLTSSGGALLQVRIPREWRELYGTAPEILVLAASGKVRGDGLQEAKRELYRRRFDLDLDLLVIVDGEDGLEERLSHLSQLWGQWVPWSRVDGSFPSLAEQLTRYLPRYDLFERQDPVRGRQVIGRNEAVTDTSRRLMKGQAVGVFGLRKIGKTTVIRAVTDRLDPISARLSLPSIDRAALDGEEAKMLVVWLDCQRIYERTVEHVAERLSRMLETRFELEQLGIARHELGESALARLDALLEGALSRTSLPIGIVFDEYDLLFEGIAGQPAIEGIEQLFGMFRAHAQETGRLALVAIGRDPDFFERPRMGGRSNPMLQWFIPRWLGPMEPEDSMELLRRIGRRVLLDVGEKSVDLARRWTGGHPLLDRQFGSSLLALARSAGSQKTHVATDPFCDDVIETFLGRGAVMTICREVLELLDTRYPGSSSLLRKICHSSESRMSAELAGTAGWFQPDARILRNFGLLQGAAGEETVPHLFRWYVRTFEPRLRKAL